MALPQLARPDVVTAVRTPEADVLRYVRDALERRGATDVRPGPLTPVTFPTGLTAYRLDVTCRLDGERLTFRAMHTDPHDGEGSVLTARRGSWE